MNLSMAMLFGAVHRGDSNEAKKLLTTAKYIDINGRDERGKTPLEYAVSCNNFLMTELLLKHGAKWNLGDKHGNTRLHDLALSWSRSNNAEQIVQLFLSNIDAININRRNCVGNTPLHFACANGNLTMVKLLINKGADITLKNHKGYRPDEVASRSGNTSVGQFLQNLIQNRKTYSFLLKSWIYFTTIGSRGHHVKENTAMKQQQSVQENLDNEKSQFLFLRFFGTSKYDYRISRRRTI